LRVNRLMQGFRGMPAADTQALFDAIVRIQDFVSAHAGSVQELDVNPLIVCGNGQGAVAADVLLRVATEMAHG